jgi:hypothetical protein
MPNATVSFSATVLDVGATTITIAQTGLDTANLDDRLWLPGTKTDQPPHSEQTYALKNIRALGNTITADGPRLLWIVPKITFKLSQAGATPSVEVTVANAPGHNSDIVYPLSAADYSAVEAFLAAAQFPAG